MYLLTGGAGFIGLNLLIALQRAGARVAVCDRLDHPAKQLAMAAHRPAYVIEPQDLPAFLNEHAKQIEAVLHLGAISSTTETDWSALQRDNVDATLSLWRWCAQRQVPLIYASSAATYGDGSQGFDDAGTIEALQRLQPLNLYARSKHDTDLAIRRMLDAGQPAPPQWAGLKFFNVYGPHERHKGEQRSSICKFYDEIVATGQARLFKSHRPDCRDGEQLRDFIAVRDCVDVVLWLLQHGATSGLFNVGTGQARSFLDVAHAVFAALGRTPRIEFIPMPPALRDKYQYFTQAAMHRLREAGYRRPFTALEEGVRHYVQDHLVREAG